VARLGALFLLLYLVGSAHPAIGDSRGGWVVLEWTAPGDDGVVGDAAIYDIRLSEDPITEANYDFAQRSLMKRAAPAGHRERCRVDGLLPGRDYYFAVRTQDAEGNWSPLSNLAVFSGRAIRSEPIGDVTGSPGDDPVPGLPPLAFSAPAPNPARYSVAFHISLPAATMVQVDVYDPSGRRLRALVASVQPAGVSRVDWDLRDSRGNRVNPGVYLVRARMDGRTWARRVAVVP
jgi:hypothetical protein